MLWNAKLLDIAFPLQVPLGIGVKKEDEIEIPTEMEGN